METCAISIQFCWTHIKRKWAYNIIKIHTMVEGTRHFLIGEPLTQLPPADYTNVKRTRLSRWQSYQQQQQFWQGWSSIYKGASTATTLTEGITQRTIRRCRAVEGRWHHSISLQLSSATSIHKRWHRMASYAWSHLGTPRELQQTSHYKTVPLSARE